MSPSTVATFARIIKDESYGEDLKIYENYSGRGMMGKTTTGIVGDQRDIITLIAEAGVQLGHVQAETAIDADLDEQGDENLKQEAILATKEVQTFLNDIKHLRWDNMGQQHIAY